VFGPGRGDPKRPLRRWCKGTNFQIKVWQALLPIPPGQLVTYGDIARAIGQPTAARLVGTAIGANPIGLLIPCHRVIRSTELFATQYRWGTDRKLALSRRQLLAIKGRPAIRSPPFVSGSHVIQYLLSSRACPGTQFLFLVSDRTPA
jgi:O-6-methylguanine DNA methyltransferase